MVNNSNTPIAPSCAGFQARGSPRAGYSLIFELDSECGHKLEAHPEKPNDVMIRCKVEIHLLASVLIQQTIAAKPDYEYYCL